ncbi:unnamed protein product [Cyprideis torosa]|uniref:Uncharacterized protein n=1 Tax=Cyprideis torosa TaxID=163714 RepID=A0A7R8W5U8_9CRUS|nr:unnamed protein product [Cyprideis torosa]CAG0885608.1 unnamed protein product [Cyprideis torosa]
MGGHATAALLALSLQVIIGNIEGCQDKYPAIPDNVIKKGPAPVEGTAFFVLLVKCQPALFVLDIPGQVSVNQVLLTCETTKNNTWKPIQRIHSCIPKTLKDRLGEEPSNNEDLLASMESGLTANQPYDIVGFTADGLLQDLGAVREKLQNVNETKSRWIAEKEEKLLKLQEEAGLRIFGAGLGKQQTYYLITFGALALGLSAIIICLCITGIRKGNELDP